MAPTIKELIKKRKDGTLTGFACKGCGKTWVTPVARCSACGKDAFETKALPTTGKVLTYTIQNVASEEFMNEVPYAWAVIRLDDGTNVTGWIPYIASDRDLAIGDAVKYTPTYKPGVMFEKA